MNERRSITSRKAVKGTEKMGDTNHPVPRRICACGCGTEFQPSRRNQTCVDRVHANYKYNHQDRKERNRVVNDIEKILRKNDRILAKYYMAGEGLEPNCFLLNLTADGFDTNYFIGKTGDVSNPYITLYNYQYQTYQFERRTLVKIKKYEFKQNIRRRLDPRGNGHDGQ